MNDANFFTDYKYLSDRSSTTLGIYSKACGITYSLCRVTPASTSRSVDQGVEAPVLAVADLLSYRVIREARYLES